jgi:hypothetical protein
MSDKKRAVDGSVAQTTNFFRSLVVVAAAPFIGRLSIIALPTHCILSHHSSLSMYT